MTVRSEELQNGQRVAAKPAPRSTPPPVVVRVSIAVSMAIVGIILWWLGASASLDGWIIGLNIASEVMRVSAHVGDVPGLARLPLITAIGLVYSLNELYLRPIRGYLIPTVLLIILTHATDVGSTYLFVATLRPGAWPIQVWAAANIWPAALYSIGLTYLPETLLLTAYGILRGR